MDLESIINAILTLLVWPFSWLPTFFEFVTQRQVMMGIFIGIFMCFSIVGVLGFFLYRKISPLIPTRDKNGSSIPNIIENGNLNIPALGKLLEVGFNEVTRMLPKAIQSGQSGQSGLNTQSDKSGKSN